MPLCSRWVQTLEVRGYRCRGWPRALVVVERSWEDRLSDLVGGDGRFLQDKLGAAVARYQGRGTPTAHRWAGAELVLKRARHGGLLRGLFGDRFFMVRRFLREIALTADVASAGVPTCPIVWMHAQKLGGGFVRVHLISERIAWGRDLPAWCQARISHQSPATSLPTGQAGGCRPVGTAFSAPTVLDDAHGIASARLRPAVLSDGPSHALATKPGEKSGLGEGGTALERGRRFGVLRALGKTLAKFHGAGFSHHDLNVKNLVIDDHGPFPVAHILDLEGSKRFPAPLSERERLGNLARLWRSARKQQALGRWTLGSPDGLRVLFAYCRESTRDRAAARRMTRDYLRRLDRGFTLHRCCWRFARSERRQATQSDRDLRARRAD